MLKFLGTKKKKLLALVVIPMLIIIGVVVLLVKALNSPAEGTITRTVDKSLSPKTSQKSLKRYSDKYIAFTYPAGYEIREAEKDSIYIDKVNLFSTDHTNKHVAISVVKESLPNDSGINLRKSKPEIYKQISESPSSIIFTSKVNGSEQTGYIQHDDMVITISITSPFKKELSTDFQTIANSLQWK